MRNYQNHSTATDTLPAVLREATAGATPERALVIRELTAITALRFKDPALYGAMVELGRNYTEPRTLDLDPDTWTAVDDDSVALRRRNVNGYLAAARFGWCPRCFASVITFPDGRRLNWPSLDHHEPGCVDVSEEVQVKAPTPNAAPERRADHRPRTLGAAR
ncbi:MAG: hypothetical protein IT300_18855 [Dehalococcoidia bacterium]|nr:hypothetical protein [Dehalococcoidia bacterium]